MIVLHRHKIIFLKPRKVAGTSFEIALSKFAFEGDIITPLTPNDEETRQRLGFRTAQNYEKSGYEVLSRPRMRDLRNLAKGRKPLKFYNHMPAREAKLLVGNDQWDSYTKVSIVRNPFDVLVSFYFWVNKGRHPDFLSWCLGNKSIVGRNNEQYTISGDTIIDYFIRYEKFEEDIVKLEALQPGIKGLYETFSSVSAKTSTRPKKGATVEEMFRGADEAARLVQEKCQYEIENFGYRLAKPSSL